MVACRITDARNIAANSHHHLHNRSTGSISSGQVPLKKYKQTGISSLTAILIAILHWIWPPDRCTNCHSIYTSPHLDDGSDARKRSVSQIQRSVDGRFILSEDEVDKKKLHCVNGDDEVDQQHTIRRHSNASQNSSSDDGGFLSRRNFTTARASWRRPLVSSPSQLSLQSAADSARGFLQGLGGLLKVGSSHANAINNVVEDSGARYQNVYRDQYGRNIYRNLQPPPSRTSSRPLHINTVSGGGVGTLESTHSHPIHPHAYLHQHPHGLVTSNMYTPSKVSRLFSSSPASTPNDGISVGNNTQHHTGGLLASPWALTSPGTGNPYNPHFSDLSSVYPSSAERSFPTPNASGNISRYRHYTHELPALRTIQEETRLMNQQQQLGFVPLQIPSPPSWRGYYPSQAPYHSYRPRTRWYPRHFSRLLGRTQSELMSPLPHLNLTLRSASAIGGGGGMGFEPSPESRSSSSGFGSKNTSNHPHGSHSGSTSEWRLLPPYRPPPPPPANSAYFGSQHAAPHYLPTQAQPQQLPAQATMPTPHLHAQQLQHPQNYSSSTLPYYSTAGPSCSLANYYSSTMQRPITPPYTITHWLDMISRLNAATDNVNLPKSVDVGSVDGHYEFDPSTPTPSASSPTGGLLREDYNLHIDTTGHHHTVGPMSGSIFHTAASALPLSGSATYGGGPIRKARTSRYDNIEARLQAMKEEFYEYRKRQAMKHAGVTELESFC